MNSVLSRSIASLDGAAPRRGRSSRARAGAAPSGSVAEGAAEDLGRRGSSRPCRAAPRRCSPSARTSSANASRSSALLEHLLGDRQPAEPVGDLGRARGAPQRLVAAARCAGRRPRRRACLTRSAIGGSSSSGRSSLDRRRAAGDDRLALALDAGEQLVHRRRRTASMPSRSSLSVTSSMSMPASAQRARGRRSGPGRPWRPVTSPLLGARPAASPSASC